MNRIWLAVLALLFSVSTQANLLGSLLGKSEPEFLPVEQAFPLTTSLADGQLLARWDSADGYYLYQHRIFLQQGDTRLEPVYFSLPGIEKDDEAFGRVTAFYGQLDVPFDLQGLQPGEVVLHHQGCADAGLCYPPQRQRLTLTAADLQGQALPPASDSATSPATAPASDNWFSGRSALAVIGVFFLLGLGLTFTPCVLPMVPILTSVVLGQQQNSPRRGFLLSSVYVLGMALTYAAAGLTVGLLGAGANIQAWMQTPWVLILFAALFVLLALAMFGLYELQLPAALRNRLNSISQQQQGGRYLNVFIIGVLSALIVSPCVSAPLAGALVYLSTTGDAALGGLALLALGLGMGAPLIVLGTTGASLLPKAGQWMNQIKVFFGVLLLGVAIWLLERILPGNLSLLLWALLALVYGIVLGALEPAASAAQRLVKGLGWVLLVYGVLAFTGVLMGNNNPLQPLQPVTGGTDNRVSASASTPFYKTDSVAELEQRIATAPGLVMLDMYADWCISCKVMEKEIFSQPDVQAQLADALWLKLDVTDNRAEHIAFMQKHAIFGPPTILFFRQNQEVQPGRLVGETDKDGFLAHLRRHQL